MSVKRTSRLKRYSANLNSRLIDTVDRSIEDGSLKIMREAKSITPVDEDNLRPSAHIHKKTKTRTRLTVDLGFGGKAGIGNVDGETNKEDVEYAVLQHENMNFNHPNGGQAKYLERPWRSGRRGLLRGVVGGIVKLLRRL